MESVEYAMKHLVVVPLEVISVTFEKGNRRHEFISEGTKPPFL